MRKEVIPGCLRAGPGQNVKKVTELRLARAKDQKIKTGPGLPEWSTFRLIKLVFGPGLTKVVYLLRAREEGRQN